MRLEEMQNFRREKSLDVIPLNQIPSRVTLTVHRSKGIIRDFRMFKDRPIVCDGDWVYFFLPENIGLLRQGPYRAKRRSVRVGENGDISQLYVATIELFRSDIPTITDKGDE